MESDLKEYKNVYKEYTEQLIAVKVPIPSQQPIFYTNSINCCKIADMANNDLEKYAKALDK